MNDAEKSALQRALAATNAFLARFADADEATQHRMVQGLEALCADPVADTDPVVPLVDPDGESLNDIPGAIPAPAADGGTDAETDADVEADVEADAGSDAADTAPTDGSIDAAPVVPGGFVFGGDPYAVPADDDAPAADVVDRVVDVDDEVELRRVGAALRLTKVDESAWTPADVAAIEAVLPGKLAVIPGEWTAGETVVDGAAVVVPLHTDIEADGTVGPGAGQLSITGPNLSCTGWLVSDDTVDGVEPGDVTGLVEACEAFVEAQRAAAYADEFGDDGDLAHAVDAAIIERFAGDVEPDATLTLFALRVDGQAIDDAHVALVEDTALTQLRNDYTSGAGANARRAFADATFALTGRANDERTGLVASRFDVTGGEARAYVDLMRRGGQAAGDVLRVDGVGDVAYALVAELGMDPDDLAQMAHQYLTAAAQRLR